MFFILNIYIQLDKKFKFLASLELFLFCMALGKKQKCSPLHFAIKNTLKPDTKHLFILNSLLRCNTIYHYIIS